MADETYRDLSEEEEEAMLEADIVALDKKIGQALVEASNTTPKALGHVIARRLGRNTHAVESWYRTALEEDDLMDDDDLGRRLF